MHTPLARQSEMVRRQSSADAGRPTRAWSLKAHLLVFGLALVLPILALAGFLLFKIDNSNRAELEQRMVQVAAGLTAEIDREIQRRITVLQTLATSPALGRGDFATFHAYAAAVLQEDKAGIFLIDAGSLQQLLNTYVSFGTDLPTYGSPETAQRVLETKRWQLSNLFVGRISQRPALDIALPIFKNETIQYILVMGLEPFMFARIVEAQKLPAEWVISVADRAGTIVVRSTNGDKYVGTKLPAVLFAQQPGTVTRNDSLEGLAVLRTPATSQLSGWQVAINLPASVTEKPLREALLYLGLWSAAALLLTALIASWFARTMAHPIAAAADAAADLAHRRAITPFQSHISEANALIDALKRAAQDLSDADAERKSAEQTRQQLATIVEASRDAIWSWAVDGAITSWNGEAEHMFGYTAEEMVGKPLLALVPPERLEAARNVISNVARGEGYGPLETVRLCKNGNPLQVELSVSPIRDSEGRVTGAATICRDITQRKHAEETEKLLVREVQHRSNNLLAIVQTIAHRSLSNGRPPAEAGQAFEARLQALARINRQLTKSDWSGLSLKEIVRQELEPFAPRAIIEGTDVTLSAQYAQNFSLSLHELATNAAKYGALSNGTGTVSVFWTIASDDKNSRLKFRWQETGGPPVIEPTRHGFGTVLLNAAFTDVRFDYAASGLGCEFEIRLDP